MDEKAIMGFVVWLFLCIGLFTVFSIPEGAGLACLGNIAGLGGLIWILRRPSIRLRLAEPRLPGLLLLLGILVAGILLSLGLGQLSRLW